MRGNILRVMVVVLMAAVLVSGVASLSFATEKQISVAFIPELIGIPYFNAMNEGGKAAAERFGVNWIYQGPTDVDAPAQLRIFDSLIAQGVDAIAVSVLDQTSICPAMERAAKAGLIPFTSDSDAPACKARALFVSQASNEGLAHAIIDGIAERLNPKDKYAAQGTIAFVSGNPTAVNLNTWMDLMKKYVKEKFPGLKIVATRYSGGSAAKAYSEAMDLFTAFPHLSAIVGVPSTSIPGVGQAVEDAGLTGKIIYTGYGSPLTAKDYIHSGAMTFSVLWNPWALGYLTVWAGWEMAQGIRFDKIPVELNLKVPGISDLPEVNVKWIPESKTLLLGPPLIITKANVDKYNF